MGSFRKDVPFHESNPFSTIKLYSWTFSLDILTSTFDLILKDILLDVPGWNMT